MSTAGRAVPAEKPTPCVARQPILTRDEKVTGYELMFRETAEETHFTAEQEAGTRSIIDTLNVMGLDVVCDGRLAFINCTQGMLLNEFFLLLPADKVVVELQENVAAAARVIAACQRLKSEGYKLALDNFVPGDRRESLLPHADFAKVDIRRVVPPESGALVAKYGATCCMLAQKVETSVQFLNAVNDGFKLFQGYFFQQPERMRARHIPANQASQLQLLKEVSAPEVDRQRVEDLIKRDASLCYRLLRLGERELVRWIRMATTLVMGQEKCSDLVLSSLVRARFCELIAPKISHGTCDLFLLGMFSLM